MPTRLPSQRQGIEKALQTVLDETRRIFVWLFYESELSRQKSDMMMTGIEKAFQRTDKTESKEFRPWAMSAIIWKTSRMSGI